MALKDYAEKHHELLKRYFPSYMIWPKKRENYVRIYQLTVSIIIIAISVWVIYRFIN